MLNARWIIRTLEQEEKETKDALTRVYFRLLHGKGYEYGLWKENLLPPSKKDKQKNDEYKRKLKEYEKKRKTWENLDSTSKKAKIPKGRKPTKPSNRTFQRYQQLLRDFSNIKFIKNLGKGEDGKHYYMANPEVIYSFIRRYALSEREFNLLKKTANNLEREFKEALDLGMKKKELLEFGLKITDEEQAKKLVETGRFGQFKMYLENPEIKLDFKRTIRLYLGLDKRFRETEMELPVTTLRPAPDTIVYDEKENTISVWDENRKIISRPVYYSLLLTWFDFDTYLERNPLLTDEEKDMLLNWCFVHLVILEYRQRGENLPLVDPKFIEKTDGHFLKEFKNWKEKLAEISIEGWIEDICICNVKEKSTGT